MGAADFLFSGQGKDTVDSVIYIVVYTKQEAMDMDTAKLFENGRSQAVRLPKKYRFEGDEVYISRLGSAVLLVPKDKVWETFLEGVNGFTEDVFAEGRYQGTQEERESL